MAKHVTIIPDCPKCGSELKRRSKRLPPFDDQHPYGSGREGWWVCVDCGYESEHFDHNPYDDVKM